MNLKLIYDDVLMVFNLGRELFLRKVSDRKFRKFRTFTDCKYVS